MLTTIDTILYATDLHKGEDATLSMAMSLAEKYQAKVVSLHVVEPVPPEVYSWAAEDMWGQIRDSSVEEAITLCKQQIDDFVESTPTTHRPEIIVAYGKSATDSLKCADDINADLIVIGSHGHSALGQLLIGSVADKVMRLSQRPVLCVPVKG